MGTIACREHYLAGGDRPDSNVLSMLVVIAVWLCSFLCLADSMQPMSLVTCAVCIGLSLVCTALCPVLIGLSTLRLAWFSYRSRKPARARVIRGRRVRAVRKSRRPLLSVNARSTRAAIRVAQQCLQSRTARRRSIAARMWALSRKARNSLMHAITGNGQVDWWWCWEQLDATVRPTKADYKKHTALLRCDGKLVQRLEDAGKTAKAVLILAAAAKRYGLCWNSGAGLSHNRSNPPPVSTAVTSPGPTKAKDAGGKGQSSNPPGPPKGSPSSGGPPTGKGKGAGAPSKSSSATWTKAPPKKVDVKFTLLPEEWSAPEVAELMPGQAGIKFCESVEIAVSQIAKVRETSQPAAVLVQDRLPNRSDHVPVVFKVVRTEDGKSREVALWGFLYNVGKGEVSHRPAFDEVKIKGKGGTSTLLVEVAKDYCEAKVWEEIMQGKLHVLRKLVFEACAQCPEGVQDIDIVDMFKLAKSGTIVSAVVRVRSDALGKCLITSGHNGIFFRPMGPHVEEYGVVWLKGEQSRDLQAARDLARQWKGQGALGLALRPQGLGIRAGKDHFDQLRTALGRDPAQTRWLVSNISWSCSDMDVEDILSSIGWIAKPLHPLRSRGGGKSSATWVVSAEGPPPKTMWRVTLDDRETFVVTVEKQMSHRPALKTWGRPNAPQREAAPQAPDCSRRAWVDVVRSLPKPADSAPDPDKRPPAPKPPASPKVCPPPALEPRDTACFLLGPMSSMRLPSGEPCRMP